MNLYAYVGNDPINATDPSGMLKCEGDSRCDAVHAAAAEARELALKAQQDLEDLAEALRNGDVLTPEQQELSDAFRQKFGNVSARRIDGVARTFGRIANRIGERGSGARVQLDANLAPGQPAEGGRGTIKISNEFFGDMNGLSRGSLIFHEGGHEAWLNDVRMPRGAPGGLGRGRPGDIRAYGVGATDWLGANAPSLAARNNDSYNCYVYQTACGGP